MLALSTPIIAAAYLLLGQPGHTGEPAPGYRPVCADAQQRAKPAPGNHITIRWVGDRHHHCRRGRRCRHG